MKSRFFLGFIWGIIFSIVVPLIVLFSGVINWSASATPSRFETAVTGLAFIKSMRARAPKIQNPIAADTNSLSGGLNHYRENCVICHAAPGLESSELAMGLNPPAPALEKPVVQKLSDGELFWIVKHGIRMTGMPAFEMTHKDQELWQLVGFVRHLPNLTEQEKQALKPAALEKEHHHDAEASVHHER